MATDTRRSQVARGFVLRGVAWKSYLNLRDDPRNNYLRMSYLDGTLILMSPEYIHDRHGWRLAQLIGMVTTALRIPCQGTGSSTLRRKGDRPRKGSGKEPDYGFYFGDHEPRMRSKADINLETDPPPDLAIEVDYKADSAKALALYARLGVPEVWRFKARTEKLWFGRLVGGSYEPIERSLNMPKLTPSLVLRALDEADRLGEMEWRNWLLDWARALPEPPAIARS